eukprot:11228970-Ditylum_brightwellii.AAC.1
MVMPMFPMFVSVSYLISRQYCARISTLSDWNASKKSICMEKDQITGTLSCISGCRCTLMLRLLAR